MGAVQSTEKRRTCEKKVEYPKYPTPKKQGFQKQNGRVDCLKRAVRDRRHVLGVSVLFIV